jgi:serine/threonine protein kinase
MFIRNGINAYEKVLEGESGFLSPKQMMRIRHGYIKESPDLLETDDIFSLGMVVLQLASRSPSSLCYKETNIRFNEDILNENLLIVSKIHSQEFHELLMRMICLEER